VPDSLLDTAATDGLRRAAAAVAASVLPVRLPDDSAQLQALVRKRVVFPTPAKDYDDAYILRYALRCAPGGCVVSNDLFRDWEAAFPPALRPVARAWISSHVISYTLGGERGGGGGLHGW
jgi:hypothetical protein